MTPKHHLGTYLNQHCKLRKYSLNPVAAAIFKSKSVGKFISIPLLQIKKGVQCSCYICVTRFFFCESKAQVRGSKHRDSHAKRKTSQPCCFCKSKHSLLVAFCFHHGCFDTTPAFVISLPTQANNSYISQNILFNVVVFFYLRLTTVLICSNSLPSLWQRKVCRT